MHAVPKPQKKEYYTMSAKIKSIIYHMVDTLSTWPKAERVRKLHKNFLRVDPAEVHERHHFVNMHDKWGCIKCGKTTNKPCDLASRTKCKGLSFASDLINNSNDHILFFCRQQGGGVLVFCNVCGAFAQTCPRLLKEKCRGPPLASEFGNVVLRRISVCQHPVSGLPILNTPMRLK